MGDSSVGKLTSSLEDLSLKKQLPLRQQALKPVLQYNNNSPSKQYSSPLQKPVQLFNESDIVALRNAANSTGSPYTYKSPPSNYVLPSGKVLSTFKEESSHHHGHSHRHKPHTPGSTTISSHPGESRSPTPTSHNSHSRPFSAKHMAHLSVQYQKSLRKLSGVSSLRSSPSPTLGSRSHSPTLQTNSFMLPHGALRPERHTHRKTPTPHPASGILKSKPTEPDIESPSTETGTSDNPLGKEACKALIQIGSLVSVGASGAEEVEKEEDNQQITSNPKPFKPSLDIVKPVLHLHRPGSSASSVGSVSSEAGGKVRNPNYTPTKPYHQVKEAEASESSSTVSLDTSPTEDIPSPTSHHSAKKSLKFYRKGSKSQEQIHEHGVRRKGDGAPDKLASRKETVSKSSSVTSDTCEGEGSEYGLPSGERLPGDGEASVETSDVDDSDTLDDLDDGVDDDDDDDDGIDDIDDDITEDNDSDGYSMTSSISKPSLVTKSRLGRQSATPCRPVSTTSDRRHLRSRSAVSDVPVYSALTPSLFSNIPPTVNFVAEGEKVEKLPWEIRKYLKWRLSPITPNVVKSALSRVGFRITKRNHDWLGCFGKHMKSHAFKAIRDYQKLNHFPGSFQLGRKDRLWRNLSKMQVHFGKKEYGFFPQTFVLPYDLKLLKGAWEDGGSKQKWIIKPPASARGIGIKVIHKWTQIPRRRPVIVQRYLAKPFLINDSKFDMRVYVYVSSCDPLRIYVYEDGLARFASTKYSTAMKNLNNKFMHLTNYSINKKNEEYQSNADDSVCQGHKWSLKALWSYLRKQGINASAIWDSVKDLIVKTVICAEASMNSLIKSNVKSRYSVHELFGFDILLDENLRPWILEVNISPSLHSNSQLDINIKGNMIKDMFNIGGFRVPDRHDVTQSGSNSYTDLSNYQPSNEYCMDKRQFCSQLAPDERAKHAYYCQRYQDQHAMQTILETLTPDDIRILTESIDEDSRKGGFQRVYPTPSTHSYMRFFEQPRYYNLLLDHWVQRFNRLEAKGISLLESFCREGIHFDLSTDNPSHQWTPPSASLISYREPRMVSAPLHKHSNDSSDLKNRGVQYSGPGQFSRSSLRQSKVMSVMVRSTPNTQSSTETVLGKPPRPPASNSDAINR